MSSLLLTRQAIGKEYSEYIKDKLKRFRIGKGIREYQRAKELIIEADMGADEAWKAIKIIAEWCNV